MNENNKSSYIRNRVTLLLCMLALLHHASALDGQPEIEIYSQQYKDWNYQCLVPQTKIKKRPRNTKNLSCEISHTVQAENNGTKVDILNMALTKINSKSDDKKAEVKHLLILIIPLALNIHLPSEFGMIIGKSEPRTAQFINCNKYGCQVVFPVDAALLKNMRHANNGTGLFRILSKKIVKVEFSLRGFSRAYRAFVSGKLPKRKKSR